MKIQLLCVRICLKTLILSYQRITIKITNILIFMFGFQQEEKIQLSTFIQQLNSRLSIIQNPVKNSCNKAQNTQYFHWPIYTKHKILTHMN